MSDYSRITLNEGVSIPNVLPYKHPYSTSKMVWRFYVDCFALNKLNILDKDNFASGEDAQMAFEQLMIAVKDFENTFVAEFDALGKG